MSLVSKTYPNIRIVEGDLEDVELVETEARTADIVLRKSATLVVSLSINGNQTLPAQGTRPVPMQL